MANCKPVTSNENENSITMDNRKLVKFCTWSWEQIVYVIVMHIVIASSALAALLFIKLNKIPMDGLQNLDGFLILFFYINAALAGPGAPPELNSSDPDIPGFGVLAIECLSHVFGLGLVVFLLHIISPKLALCVGIPSFVCLIASSCICLYASKEDLQPNENRLRA